VALCKDGPFSDWLCHNVSCNAVKMAHLLAGSPVVLVFVFHG